MIHELGNILSGKQKGALKSCTKYKTFIGRRGQTKKLLAEWIVCGKVTFL